MAAIRYPVDDPVLYRCIAISLAQKKFLRSSLKETLYHHHLYRDFHQELATAAVEAWRAGYSPDENFREIRNLVQRRLYAFLKAHGFSRHWDPDTKRQGKGFISREIVDPVEVQKRTIPARAASDSEIVARIRDFLEKEMPGGWQALQKWAASRQAAPRGKAAEALSLIKKELNLK